MRLVDSNAAARRLGVKLATLYAYVSRGVLVSYRSPDGRKSLFDLDEVERVASRARGGRQIETRLATISTAITELDEHVLAYRGVVVADLVGKMTFEEVAELLWNVGAGEWPEAPPATTVFDRPRDQIRGAVVAAAAGDRFRADLRPDSVVRSARRIITAAVASLGGSPTVPTTPVAMALAHRIGVRRATPAVVGAIDVALVLLADHELAASTLAVRVAASTRADPYDAVLSGLGCAGPRHIGASAGAHRLFLDAATHGVSAAFERALASGSGPAGFGHAVYRDQDPRFVALMPFVDKVASPRARDLIDEVVEVARTQQFGVANIDLALGALGFAIGTDEDAGVTLFSIARIAGWIAHYLEELAEPTGRFRARAIYTPQR